jgi:phi13 family phage major tail protein
MAFIGLKYPVYAPITSKPSGSLPVYGAGRNYSYATEASIALEFADSKLPGDDAIRESDKGFLSGKITQGITDLDEEACIDLLGAQEREVDGHTVIRDGGIFNPQEVGYGYYRVKRINGVRKIVAIWYYCTQWTEPSEDGKTKGESIEWQTPKIEGEIFRLDDEDETWRDRLFADSEADAISWLNEKANIGEPASKTALSASITAAQALDPEDYTSASWVDVANALEEAAAVVAMTSPAQSRVDSAKTLLDAAVESLVART